MHKVQRNRNCNSLIKIETYWNVNKNVRQALNIERMIKIETYWNVNDEF